MRKLMIGTTATGRLPAPVGSCKRLLRITGIAARRQTIGGMNSMRRTKDKNACAGNSAKSSGENTSGARGETMTAMIIIGIAATGTAISVATVMMIDRDSD